MNPAAILTLISELYSQVASLQQENKTLREQIQTMAQPAGQPQHQTGA